MINGSQFKTYSRHMFAVAISTTIRKAINGQLRVIVVAIVSSWQQGDRFDQHGNRGLILLTTNRKITIIALNKTLTAVSERQQEVSQTPRAN